ncbi:MULTISPECIES: DUF559 domain-containing protein [unclassified Nocardioides]|uniref:DUF559 domain-containing protein n=1 Tax=unclassified Nocardioides TaxID=2615069 RepID=UPI0006F377DE|nr:MULTISPECIES: DUF559 domain-containing protein [unclassified Nocardioides]KRA29674.1 hypothetical protein ASD81_22230 [Nocardioides sp. Root614]KRA88151.1 hypothetical protein ASD84_19385 [Nocardioides sp. Root682]
MDEQPRRPTIWHILVRALLARAALLPFGDAARGSHSTAARAWRLPVPIDPDEHVTVPTAAERRSRAGVRCHVDPDGRSVVVDGIRVSALPETFVELAQKLPLVDLVVVGDAMVRRMIGLDELRRHCADASGPGAAQARAALAFVRSRVDSPMETRLRMLIVLAGLPEPQVNLTVGDPLTMARRKYDLSWPEVRLVVEYDGRQHVDRVDQWESDLERREAIDDDGWRIIVVVARGIYARPDQTLSRIHRLLVERGHPDVPRRMSEAWRAHFPVHA